MAESDTEATDSPSTTALTIPDSMTSNEQRQVCDRGNVCLTEAVAIYDVGQRDDCLDLRVWARWGRDL